MSLMFYISFPARAHPTTNMTIGIVPKLGLERDGMRLTQKNGVIILQK